MIVVKFAMEPAILNKAISVSGRRLSAWWIFYYLFITESGKRIA